MSVGYRWVRLFRATTLAYGLLLSACSTAAPGARSEAVAPVAERTPNPRIAAAALAAKNATGRTEAANPTSTSAPRFGLILPHANEFLAAALPESHPERYATFRQTSQIGVGRGYLFQLDLLGEGLLFVAGGDEATVRVYEQKTARLVGNHPIPGFRQFETGGVVAGFGPAPTFVAATPEGLLLVDARTGKTVSSLDAQAARALRWSPDRRVLVAQSPIAEPNFSRLRFLGVRAGDAVSPGLNLLGTLDFEERVDDWDLSADNRLLVVSHYPSGDLRVIDLHHGTDVLRVPGPRYAGAVAFSPDGRLVAVGGHGLLLVDVLHPERRAFYSYLGNNIGHVRFSPSGDAVVASSYDGRVRVFHYTEALRTHAAADSASKLELTLVKELRHAGSANVYAFVFEPDGDGIISASGDQTIRTFRGRATPSRAAAPSAPIRTFHTLEDWQRLDAEGTPPDGTLLAANQLAANQLAANQLAPLVDGHYFPPWATGEPRPSRIKPGRYACKITQIYKLRDCVVTQDAAGHTWLEFDSANLLGLKGILYDDGPVVRFAGWLTQPSTVVGCNGCEKQPLHALFRGAGRNWQGLLTFQDYYDPLVPPEPPAATVKIEEALDRFPLVLRYQSPLSPAR